jgi:hypothetical protein
MPNPTEVNRARIQILTERDPNSVISEERYLSQADLGAIVVGKENAINVSADLLAGSIPGQWLWIAPFPCRVTAIRAVWSVAGGSAANVRPRKITADATAPGAAAGATVIELTAAVIDLTATANVLTSPALSATASDLVFATGDRLALLFTGTLTGLVGKLCVTFAAI